VQSVRRPTWLHLLDHRMVFGSARQRYIYFCRDLLEVVVDFRIVFDHLITEVFNLVAAAFFAAGLPSSTSIIPPSAAFLINVFFQRDRSLLVASSAGDEHLKRR
jgi:hypothetical protein